MSAASAGSPWRFGNHEGIEYANANLMGEVALGWDEERTSKDEIVAALARSGFPEIATERE